VCLGVVERHREFFGDGGGDRTIKERDVQPFGERRADAAAAGAVRSGERDEGHCVVARSTRGAGAGASCAVGLRSSSR
jgi:hypothetical protein